MKKLLIVSLGIFLLATQGFAQGTIVGSAHDFSAAGWNSTTEICVVCHTPHNASTEPNAPLWNHEIQTSTFTIYTSLTFDAGTGFGHSQPDGVSKLCLSCHDGSVAIDNFGGVTTGTTFMTGNALLGTDLTNDHPVSFDFTTALATLDGGLHDPSTQASGLGGTIQNDMLRGNKVQCVSCHEPHNAYGNAKFLRIANTASALCLTCHDK